MIYSIYYCPILFNFQFNMKAYRFQSKKDDQFVRTLNERVEAFLREQNISRKANNLMILKTIIHFGVFIGIYVLILSDQIHNLTIAFLLWVLLGVGQAIIGMTIMHDTVHGAYSVKKWVNILLEVPIIAIGVESAIWKIEHNFFHHNFTNMEGIDQDIHPRYLFRFSKHQPRKWFHRFQHIYAVLLYSLLTFEWMTAKDFIKVNKYYKEGVIPEKKKAWTLATVILIKKLIFFTLYLMIPILVLSFPWYLVVLMFLTKLAVSGIIMTIIFQTAHVVPNCDFLNPISLELKDSWHMHQLRTTANFAHGHRVVTYLLGGLNYQIEHHLYPDICHVHYPQLSSIVKKTAQEFSIPYHENSSLWTAILGHFALLKMRGKEE